MSLIRRTFAAAAFASFALAAGAVSARQAPPTAVYPANGARQVNPDVQLTLTFETPPAVGAGGLVRIVDAATGEVVDTLDLSIPVSPNPTGRVIGADGSTRAPVPPAPAGPDNPGFQHTQASGAWFHFFPVTVDGDRATIHPHNRKLAYGRDYIVRIDPEVLIFAGGQPLTGPLEWRFSTKAAPPSTNASRVIVDDDGTGDFDTVQGAIEFAPTAPDRPFEVFVRNGDYREIVYLKGKSNLTIRGESREGVVVHYPNNSAFNRIRPVFTVTEANDVQLSTFTIRNDFIGQAEALLMRGERNIIARMTLNGSGDALQTHGSIYMVDSTLTGDGDTILAYATLFCLRCEIHSVGPFTWTRTPEGRHGNVFVDSTFIYSDRPLPWSITADHPEGRKTPGVLARLPRNGAADTSYANFPYAEMVLINARTDGLPVEGWGPVEDRATFDWSTVRFMEFGTTDIQGRAVDLSQRHPIVQVLTLPDDAALIANYRRPEFVFSGWEPHVRE